MNYDEFNREIRADFPALQRVIDGFPVAFLDGPGGYQVPQAVIDAMVDYLARTNANFDGVFTTSRETGEVVDNARKAFADFFHCDHDHPDLYAGPGAGAGTEGRRSGAHH